MAYRGVRESGAATFLCGKARPCWQSLPESAIGDF